MPDRSALKRNATEKIRTSNPRVITVALVYLLLSLLVNLLSSRLLSINMTDADAARYLQYYAEGNYEYALRYLDIIAPPATSYFLDTLLTVVMSIVGAGFILFLLNTARSNAPCFGNLLDGFGFGLKVVILNILEAVFGALAGFAGIPAAFEKTKKRFWLIAPAAICLVCACAADGISMYLGLGQMYTVIAAAIFAAVQLAAALPKAKT